jgi:hypothetical protein
MAAAEDADAQYPGDDDALFVLTAAMLTPERFPGVLGDDYPAACAGLGLDPRDAGYGLVFGQDGGGARWTVATTDTALVACALAAWDCGLPYDLSPGEETMTASLPGWPLPVAVSVPGLPAPHDPDEQTGGGPPLTAPDTSVWGPAQRRLGADEIAVHWRQWRDEFATAGPAPESGTTAQPGTASQPPSGAAGTRSGAAAPGDAHDPVEPADLPLAVSHDGVRRALAAAEEYLLRPPPPGRIRAAYGAVRADGPGWSLVARTDDMAFVLLDDAPGAVLPVGRGPALPPLLAGLAALAGPASAHTAPA